MPRKFPLALTITAFVLAIFVVGSLLWCWYFQGRALARSFVGEVSIAGLTQDAATERVNKQGPRAATLTVKAGDKTETFSADALSLSPDAPASVAPAFTDRSFFSPLWPGAHKYPLVLKGEVSIAQVEKSFANLVPEDQRGKQAQVTFDPKSHAFTVSTPAKIGKALDFSEVEVAAKELAKTGNSQSATVAIKEAKPKLSTEQAEQWAKQASRLTTAPFELLTGQALVRVEATELAKFVVPLEKSEDGKAAVDEAAIKAWVDQKIKDLEEKHAVPGRRSVNAEGKELVVIARPIPALTFANPDQATSDITNAAKNLLAAKEVKFPIDVKTTASQPSWIDVRVKPSEYIKLPYQAKGNERWIDVNLSNRQTTVYQGDTPIYGPVKMVPGAPETPTLEGTFKVYLRRPIQTLVGTNADGSPYRVPDVPWLLYYDGSYALHAAYWRNEWGFDAKDGSHGCVNLPVQVAKDIYDLSPLGTVVHIHR